MVGAASLDTLNIAGVYVPPVNLWSIVGTEGANLISNSIDGGNINALGGDDSISNSGSNVKIDAGYGNDSIQNYGSGVTIKGGWGNDSIRNTGNNVLFQYEGDGNDTIWGFNETSTLQIGDGTGNYLPETIGNDIAVQVGIYRVTLVGAASISSPKISGVDARNVVGTSGADDIHNTMVGATIKTFAGNDQIINRASNVLIEAGDDTVYNYGGNTFQYNPGDGNDFIVYFNTGSVLQIGNGTGTYSTQISGNGNSVWVNVGDDVITLYGAASLSALNIVGVNPYDHCRDFGRGYSYQ